MDLKFLESADLMSAFPNPRLFSTGGKLYGLCGVDVWIHKTGIFIIERGRFFEPAGGGCHCVYCVLCIVYYKSTINWHLFPRKKFNWSGGKITSWITFHIFIRHFHA